MYDNKLFIVKYDFYRDSEKQKEIAMLEAQVYRFTELLSEQRAATKENVTRKQARTGEERDESDEEGAAADSDEDEDDVPYNPKNLPLGWDGKVRQIIKKNYFLIVQSLLHCSSFSMYVYVVNPN